VLAEQKRTKMLLGVAVYFGGGLAAGVVLVQFLMRWYYLIE
jgi:ubiquinone biosynthesis protein